MMSLFLLVIFTQATRAGNNSKAETFPLGLQEGAAVHALVAVARAPAREVGAVSGHQAKSVTFGMPCCAELAHCPLLTAALAWEAKFFGSTCQRGHESRCMKMLAGLYLGHQLRYLQISVKLWPQHVCVAGGRAWKCAGPTRHTCHDQTCDPRGSCQPCTGDLCMLVPCLCVRAILPLNAGCWLGLELPVEPGWPLQSSQKFLAR